MKASFFFPQKNALDPFSFVNILALFGDDRIQARFKKIKRSADEYWTYTNTDGFVFFDK